MTDLELVDLFFSGQKPATVSMSKAGVFLCVGDARHEITEHQAELIWNVMLFPRQVSELPPAMRANSDQADGTKA